MNTSFVVRQFMSAIRSQPAELEKRWFQTILKSELKTKVNSVKTEYCYCLNCQVAGEQDVVLFENGLIWRVCRCCKRVSENGYLTDWLLCDDGSLVLGEKK